MPESYNFDLYRLLLGDHPPAMLLEVALRTVVLYLYTLLMLRFMGKRGMGRLSPFEFAIVIALGTAVGDGLIYADTPLLHSMLVIALIVHLQRSLTALTESNPRLERFFEDESTQLVDRGEVLVHALRREKVSRDELFEGLRQEGVRHLGEVEQAYLERSGVLSVLRASPVRAGLPVLPQGGAPDDALSGEALCCSCCGHMAGHRVAGWVCPRCGETGLTAAKAPDPGD